MIGVICAICILLSSFWIGAVYADDETNILSDNSEMSISVHQVAIDRLDWAKTQFSYEGKALTDAFVVGGSDIESATTIWTDGDNSNVAHFNSRNTAITNATAISAQEAATRRLALKIDLGGHYDASLLKISVQNGGWAAARRIFSYNVYGTKEYSESTILDDDNLIGSFIVDPQNYYSGSAREVTFTDAKYIRYVVIVLNLLGSDPGIKDNTILTDLSGVPVTPATSYLFSDINGKNAGYDRYAGIPFISEIELMGKKSQGEPNPEPEKNVLVDNSNLTVTPHQISIDRLDWTKTEFSYEGKTLSDAFVVGGSDIATAKTVWTDSDYSNVAYTNSKNTPISPAGAISAKEAATRRLAIKLDLGGYYEASLLKIGVQNGGWATARRILSYNVYGTEEYNEATMLKDENLIGSFIADGQNYYQGTPREATLTGASKIRYVVIVFNLLGSDPGLKDNTILTDLTDVTVTPATSYIFADVNGSNKGYDAYAGIPFISEIELIGRLVEKVPEIVPEKNVVVNNSRVSITPHQISIDRLDWTKTEFSYEGKTLEDGFVVGGYSQEEATDIWTDSNGSNVAYINSRNTAISPAGAISAQEVATRRLALKLDLGDYYEASLIKVAVQNGGWAAARRIFSYNVYGTENYDAVTILNDENLLGTYMSNGDDYYLASAREAALTGASKIRYVVIVFNLLGSDPGLKDNTILTDLTDVPVTLPTNAIFCDLNGKNMGYDAYAGIPFISEIELIGRFVSAADTDDKDDNEKDDEEEDDDKDTDTDINTDVNILSKNPYAKITTHQVEIDLLDWTASSFSYNGKVLKDAYVVGGLSANIDKQTNDIFATETWINGSKSDFIRFNSKEFWDASADAVPPTAAEIAKRRLAVKIDLGGLCDVSEIKISSHNASWAAARRIFSYNVYASAMDDKNVLNDDHLVGAFMVDGSNFYSADSRVAEVKTNGKVQYLVVVFNLLGSDPGVYKNTIMTDLTGVSVKPATSYLFEDLKASNSEGSGYVKFAGAPWISEIEVMGKSDIKPVEEEEEKKIVLTGSNILSGNSNVKAWILSTGFDFSWDAAYPFTYNTDTTLDKENFSKTEMEKLKDCFNGKYDDLFLHQLSGGGGTSHRRGILIDLGDYYDLNGIKLFIPDDKDAKDDTSQITYLRRYLYNYSVYGGVIDNEKILLNPIGYGGEAYEFEQRKKRALTANDVTASGYKHKSEFTSELTSSDSVRYLVVMFDKLGADVGNLNDTKFNTTITGTKNALPGCSWANSAFALSEIEVYGKKGTNPTQTLVETNEEYGVAVEVVTYANSEKLEKINITAAPMDESQKGVLMEYGLTSAFGMFNIEFLNASGKPANMEGRLVTIKFKMEMGDEMLFTLDEAGNLIPLDSELYSIEDDSLVYSSEGENIICNFLVATTDYGEDVETEKEPEADTDIEKVVSVPEKNSDLPWLIGGGVYNALMISLGIILIILYKKKKIFK